MFVIFSQDEVLIKNDGEAAKEDIFRLYGNKIGGEAYQWMKSAKTNDSFRKNGGPLIKCVTREYADMIFDKEKELEMKQL